MLAVHLDDSINLKKDEYTGKTLQIANFLADATFQSNVPKEIKTGKKILSIPWIPLAQTQVWITAEESRF